MIVIFNGEYFPSAPKLAPPGLQYTARAGQNVWFRPGGGVEAINGTAAISATAVGARIFAADLDRWEIAGGLVSNRLPYAGLLRHSSGVIFFLHESASVQVYKNETAVAGMTASATPGQLRVAVPDGAGGFNTYDAGFDKPATPTTAVNAGGGTKAMAGRTGVALAAWRTTTNAIGPPSQITYLDMQPSTSDTISQTLPTMFSNGQDGWIYAGTRPGDSGGELHVVRYIYTTIRGTFRAQNGNATIDNGVGTFFQQDLRAGDVGTILGVPYTIVGVNNNGSATINPAYAGATASGLTFVLTSVAADWYDAEVNLSPIVRQDIIKPPPGAGVFTYAGHVFIWGVTDRTKNPTAVTGNAIVAMLDNNPEHCAAQGLMLVEDGGDIVNVLGSDLQLIIMTTTGLNFADFTGEYPRPYRIRSVAQPGFKSTTTGCIYKNNFYGFNKRPVRILANGEADVSFNAPIWSDMATWNPQRVLIAVDPNNEAVLYLFDNMSAATTVLPYMTAEERWNPPMVFASRFMDSALVDGDLYLTFLNIIGPTYLVVKWEGGTGLTAYVASQYYKISAFMDTVATIKYLQVAGKLASVTVFSAVPGLPTPDVSNPANGDTFTLSGADEIDAIYTSIDATEFALGFSFTGGISHNFQVAAVQAIQKMSVR